MDVYTAYSQTNTIEGMLQVIAYEDLQSKEGRLVKLVDDSNIISEINERLADD